MPTEITELDDKRDAAFRIFWEERHPLPVDQTGLDESNPLHAVFVEREKEGPWDGVAPRVISACVFVPIFSANVFRGHVAYLASDHRSKMLVRFCKKVMEIIGSDRRFELIDIETRGMPELKGVSKLALHIGFDPVDVNEEGWTDYIWNSKGGQ